MKKIKKISALLFILGLTACLGSATTGGDQLPDKEKNTVEIPEEYINKDLEKDAESGKTYSENYYCVLTEKNTSLYDVNATLTGKTAVRGTVFSKIIGAESPEGYFAVLINGETVYLSNESAFFEQEVKGMRYPLYGIVESDKDDVTWYDEKQQKNRKFSLKKGTVYLYVITKDNSYINVWNPEENVFVTAEYCCKVKIIQAKDHAKLLRDYKTKMARILE